MTSVLMSRSSEGVSLAVDVDGVVTFPSDSCRELLADPAASCVCTAASVKWALRRRRLKNFSLSSFTVNSEFVMMMMLMVVVVVVMIMMTTTTMMMVVAVVVVVMMMMTMMMMMMMMVVVVVVVVVMMMMVTTAMMMMLLLMMMMSVHKSFTPNKSKSLNFHKLSSPSAQAVLSEIRNLFFLERMF